jgi:hypothetical protein
MTSFRAGVISCHFELAPQLPLVPVPPAHCLSLTSLVIDSDRSITSMMSGGSILALWVLVPQFASSDPVTLPPPPVPVDPPVTMTGVPPVPPLPVVGAPPPLPVCGPASWAPPGWSLDLNEHPAIARAAIINEERAVDPNIAASSITEGGWMLPSPYT